MNDTFEFVPTLCLICNTVPCSCTSTGVPWGVGSITFGPLVREGWKCPSCETVWSPDQRYCKKCAGEGLW